jgi:hypothetical protein
MQRGTRVSEIVGSSRILGFLASRILPNGPPQDLRDQPYAARSAKSRSQASKKSRIQEGCKRGTRARSLALLEFLASWLLEFSLMGRRKISGNSRTLGFLREAQNSGVKHPRSQEFENDAMRNSREIVGSSRILGFLASRILLNGPPQDLREQPYAWVS